MNIITKTIKTLPNGDTEGFSFITTDAVPEQTSGMDIIELAREAGCSSDDPSDLLTIGNLTRFAALVRAQALEEAAKKRAKPPRELPGCGTGALWAEQQHCYERGYREGAAAVRAAIRQLKEKT